MFLYSVSCLPPSLLFNGVFGRVVMHQCSLIPLHQTRQRDSPANNPSLRGFEVIENAKARLEAICKGVVSCADIVAFATRDSVELVRDTLLDVLKTLLVNLVKHIFESMTLISFMQTRGLGYDVPAGRRDGKISLASETLTNLPPPSFNVEQLTKFFSNKGFTQEEMVTLSGAHTIGRSHYTSFSNRLYNFNGTTGQDPSLDPMYASWLKQQCPQGNTNPNLVVPMDPSSPAITDSGYYMNILANQGLFTSDQTLMTNAATTNQVNQNARSTMLWKFATAMVKMGQLDVLTGNGGEIHSNCRVINS